MLLLVGQVSVLSFVTMGNMPETACVVSSPSRGNTETGTMIVPT